MAASLHSIVFNKGRYFYFKGNNIQQTFVTFGITFLDFNKIVLYESLKCF